MLKKIEEKLWGDVWDGKMKNFHREIESIKVPGRHYRITKYNT